MLTKFEDNRNQSLCCEFVGNLPVRPKKYHERDPCLYPFVFSKLFQSERPNMFFLYE